MADDPVRKNLRRKEDLRKVIWALAHVFQTDSVFIAGSPILMAMADAPEVVRQSQPGLSAYTVSMSAT
jgi:hypothetical protein